MLNKLAARSRRQRKRQASKKRRATWHIRGYDMLDE